MINSQDISLINSLGLIGQNESLRIRHLQLCREIEETIHLINRSVRDEVTGPIIDALHSGVGILKKPVKPGLIFYYRYTSKLARELVMGEEDEPDHVWEPQTTKLLAYLCQDVEHAVIGGAYFGDQAVIISKYMADRGGICHAFEPNRNSFNLLCLNKEQNSLDNLKCSCMGLWSADDKKIILVGKEDLTAHPELTGGEATEEGIPTVSINRYGAKNSIDQIGLIMLDLEGGEYEALRGADAYLSQPAEKAPAVVFEIHSNYCDWSQGLDRTEIIQYLKGFDYHVYAIRDYQGHVPMGNSPIELIEPDRTYLLGPPHGFNMLAVKKTAFVQSNLFRLCYDVSPKLLKHKDPNLHHPMY